MDESNNTPDEIDRNQLVGGIYLQPTKTAEFIILTLTFFQQEHIFKKLKSNIYNNNNNIKLKKMAILNTNEIMFTAFEPKLQIGLMFMRIKHS